MREIMAEDSIMGRYVYCFQHLAVHSTGWCTVRNSDKIALQATTSEAAWQEVQDLGLPIYNYCEVCYCWFPEYRDGVHWCDECKLSNPL